MCFIFGILIGFCIAICFPETVFKINNKLMDFIEKEHKCNKDDK